MALHYTDLLLAQRHNFKLQTKLKTCRGGNAKNLFMLSFITKF